MAAVLYWATAAFTIAVSCSPTAVGDATAAPRSLAAGTVQSQTRKTIPAQRSSGNFRVCLHRQVQTGESSSVWCPGWRQATPLQPQKPSSRAGTLPRYRARLLPGQSMERRAHVCTYQPRLVFSAGALVVDSGQELKRKGTIY